jgi:hypothetical protein
MPSVHPTEGSSFLFVSSVVTKGAESKSDEQELLARMRVRSRTRGCMRRMDGADGGRQALLVLVLSQHPASGGVRIGIGTTHRRPGTRVSLRAKYRGAVRIRMFKLFMKA